MKTVWQLAQRFFGRLASERTDAANDELCLRRALEQFLKSGLKEDAFEVYFCFCERFRLFGKGYDNTQKLLETLSDHEYHSGELLAKHRDHYSHSVYVFALGLAIYANDRAFLAVFDRFYGESEQPTRRFLYLWGLCALFHDIGYPFQLAHEQIKQYTRELWGEGAAANPYVSFGNMDAFTAVDEDDRLRIARTLGVDRAFPTYDSLFAYGLKLRKGYDETAVERSLAARVRVQPAFMDHGYFSAVILVKQLLAVPEFTLTQARLDVLTAILLHNSFNKFDAPGRSPVAADEHPLAYLLILCDELQNWDRLAYGKVSKRDPIAWDVRLEIGAGALSAVYFFDARTVRDEDDELRPNKSFAEIESGAFARKIGTFVVLSSALSVRAEEKEKRKRSALYASDNSFINLCDFAKAIHASYLDFCRQLDADHINESFERLPLEFKISNIEQAKSYAYKLELINCFYSSKDLDYPVVEDFRAANCGAVGGDNLGFLCREEHVRWVREKLSMGWKYGTDYASTQERNAKKIHKDLVPYEVLTPSEQKKDEVMINNIIPLLKKFGNNIRIYSYRTGRKPDLEIAGIGHRFFTGDRAALGRSIKKILLRYAERYRVVVRTCYAYGADQLIAECAAELGITTKAVLPAPYEAYIRTVRRDCLAAGVPFGEAEELRMRHLLAQTAVCKVVADADAFYAAASRYIVEKCQKVIALWDERELPLYDAEGRPVNRGGTYHSICMAQERGLALGKDIHIIHCDR